MRPPKPIRLSEKELGILRRWAANEDGDPQLRTRAAVILELAGGTSYARIRKKLGVSSTTAGKWKRRFLEKRLAGLRDGPPGRPRKVTEAVETDVIEAATAGRIADGGRPGLSKLARDHGLGRSTVHRIVSSFGIGPIGTGELADGLDMGEVVTTHGDYKIVKGTLRRFGRRFPFVLCRRTLEMDPAGDLVYYWMDSSALRCGEGVNFSSCIGSWWAAMEFEGWSHEKRVLETRVLAESYRRLGRARGMQKVFLDAHLSSSTALPRDYSLPPGEYKLLRDMALRRDIDGVRREFESAFRVVEVMPEDARERVTKEAEAWLGSGVLAFEQDGDEGLRAWVDEWLVPRMDKLRKDGSRGGRKPEVRLLLNAWTYVTKVSFYATVANAWGILLRELESDGLDVRSSRFMRLWHMQHPNDSEDVFWQQILSLHPLSGRVMLHYLDRRTRQVVSNAGYRAVIGKWLLRARPGHFDAADHDCDEYWEVVAVIMAAAREYTHLHDASVAPRRKIRTSKRKSAGKEEAPLSAEELLDAFAYDRGYNCPDCGELLVYKRGSMKTVKKGTVFATYVCPACPHSVEHEIERTDYSGDDA